MVKPYNDEEVAKKNAELEKKFKAERDSWQTSVSELVDMVKQTSKLTDCMVMALSYRQQIIERVAYYRQSLYKHKAKYDVLRADRYKMYTIEGDIKYNSTEKNDAVNADLKSVMYQLNLIQNQIDYLNETNQTLTNLQFAVKNKITIETEQLM
jgi:hypothetical protein